MSVDTADARTVTLLGDPGAGKTTLARYLLRWWTADPSRSCRVFATNPHHYVDRRLNVHELTPHTTIAAPTDPREVTLIDGADSLPLTHLEELTRGPGFTIVTSYGPAAQALDGSGHRCLALLSRQTRPLTSSHVPRPGLDPAQGRLDWPGDTEAVIPDQRGDHDFPRHRWQHMGRAAV